MQHIESNDEQDNESTVLINPDGNAEEGDESQDCFVDNHGLGNEPLLIDASAYESGVCTIADTGFSTPGLHSNDEASDSDSTSQANECEV